jgi:hypothetical protein
VSEHIYPDKYPPGTHWATDAAWEILDSLAPGTIPIDVRSLLAGMIAGRLMRERQHTQGDAPPVGPIALEARRRAR